jgi:flagellar hook-associated protein 3 FlgL
MPGFYPVPSTRSTNLLMQTRVVEQLNFDSLALQRLQTQISTGLKISTPGEDPAIADRAITLQRLIELKNQTKTNIQASQSYLDASDTALSNVAKLLTDVRSAVVAANSDTSSDAMRQAAAQQVEQAITQLLNTGNTNFRGRYIFAGSRSTAAPFSQTAGGVVYTGNEGMLRSFVDLNLPYATNANGQEVFGTFSPQVQGTVDLNPVLTPNTPISALNGGNGLTLGSIRISDGTTTKTVDLSSAATVGDIAALIDANPPTGRTLTTTITATGLSIDIDDAGGGNLTITEAPGGSTANALHILNSVGTGTAPVLGANLNPAIRLTTPLADLQTAAPLDLTSGLQIINGGQTYVIDTSTAQNVEDLLNLINGAGANAIAQIAPSGDRLIVRSRLSGADFSIGENGGTTATQLGLRSLTTETPLSELNYGQGVAQNTGPDFTIHRKDGTDLSIDISTAATIGDVIDLISNDPNNLNPATQVVARLSPLGNGIELFDGNTAGTDTLSVTQQFGSDAAFDLGLIPRGSTTATATTSATGDTLTGADPNPQEVSGLFNTLYRLRDALTNFSHEKLARAAALLDEDYDRVNFARSELGARNQAIDTIKSQLDDETVQLKSNLSDAIDTNLPDAIASLTARQAALQASLKLTGIIFQTSLVDYL